MLHGFNGVRTLRSHMAAGVDPTRGFTEDELGEFARMAILDVPAVVDPERFAAEVEADVAELLASDYTEALCLAWKAEMAGDPEVRAWFISLLPAEVRASLEVEGELARRPFGIEGEDGPYRCGDCEALGVGGHLAVVDRCGWLRPDVSPSELTWCLDCIGAALRGLGLTAAQLASLVGG